MAQQISVHTDSVQSEKTSAFISQFAPAGANGYSLDGKVGSKRQLAAQADLSNMQMPTTRWEAWKYTSVKSLTQVDFHSPSPAKISDISSWKIPGLDAHILVFVNGVFDQDLSDSNFAQAGVTLSPWKNLEGEERNHFEKHFGSVIPHGKDLFTALNMAYAREGLFVHIDKSKVVEKPIHIIHLSDVSTPAAIQARNLFLVEANAEVKMVETYHSLSGEKTLRNHVSEVIVGANASFEYIKIQSESDVASMIDNTEIRQGKDSKSSIFTLTFGGDLVRNNLQYDLVEPHTESHLLGLYMLSGEQHVDNHTLVNHRKPNSYSNELYKGIVTERSTGVFNGKIHVFQEAQKTNAFQSNRNILLSETSNVYTQPQLEIYADDVKCSHGATTGRIEEDALFYLRARGIPEMEAKKLMIQAFSGEVIQEISLDPVREYLEEKIQHRFG